MKYQSIYWRFNLEILVYWYSKWDPPSNLHFIDLCTIANVLKSHLCYREYSRFMSGHVCVFCSKKTPLSLSHRRCPTRPYAQSWHKASYIFLYSLSIWVCPHKQKNKHLLIIVNYSCQLLNKQQRHTFECVWKTQERAERESSSSTVEAHLSFRM